MDSNPLLKIIILLTFVLSINNMTLFLNMKKEICLNKDLNKDDHLNITFSVSGDDEYGVSSRLTGPDSITLFKHNSANYYEFNQKVEHQGTYTLCFQQVTGRNYVFFKFESKEEGGHVVNIAKEEVFTGMKTEIISMSEVFEMMENNIKEFEVKKSVHNKVVSELIDSVKNYAIYKLLIIVAITMLQIYFIRKMFENRKVSFDIRNPFAQSTI